MFKVFYLVQHRFRPLRFSLSLWGAVVLAAVSAQLVGADDTPLERDLRGVVTLAQAVDAALRQNPDLTAASQGIGIQEAIAIQAGLRPNPGLAVDAEDIARSGSRRAWDAGETTLRLSQLFEVGGKRAKRRRAAELELDVVSWEIEVRRRALVADVGKAFAATLVAQERLTLIDELIRIGDGSVRSVAATVEAGAVSPVEQRRAEVALSRGRASRLAAERDLFAARTTLASGWGSSTPTFDRAAGRLDPVAKPPALEALLPRVQAIPDLARFESELARRQAVLAFERSRRIPDMTLIAGGRHYADQGDGGLVLGFSLPLPLFDQNQGNILAAARAETQARLEVTAMAITAETRARQAHAMLEAAFEQITQLRDRIIPEATRAYDGAKDAYTRGLFRYLEVLDAQRTLFELRLEYLVALGLYHQAAAELSRWVADAQEATPTNTSVGGPR